MRSIFIIIFSIISFAVTAQITVAPEILRDAAQKTQVGISDPTLRPLNDYPYFYNQITRTLWKYNFMQNRWIAQGSVGTNVMANLSYTPSATDGVTTNTNGTGFTIPIASSTIAGLQSASDKQKLDALNQTDNGSGTTVTPLGGGHEKIDWTGTLDQPALIDANGYDITMQNAENATLQSQTATLVKGDKYLHLESDNFIISDFLKNNKRTDFDALVLQNGNELYTIDKSDVLNIVRDNTTNSLTSVGNAITSTVNGISSSTTLPSETAANTPSTAIVASPTTIPITATNTQTAIAQLATAAKASQITSTAISNPSGNQFAISVTQGATTITSNTVTLPNETATNTPSTAIVASGTSVAVPSTNVQGAISDLATAVKTASVSSVVMANPSGNQITTTVNGVTSNAITLANETAANTPFTPIVADATHIANSATTTQAAIDNMAIDAKKTMHKNAGGTAWDATALPIANIPTGVGTLTDIARKDASGNMVYGTVAALSSELGLARPVGEVVYGTGTGVTSENKYIYSSSANRLHIGANTTATGVYEEKLWLGNIGGNYPLTSFNTKNIAGLGYLELHSYSLGQNIEISSNYSSGKSAPYVSFGGSTNNNSYIQNGYGGIVDFFKVHNDPTQNRLYLRDNLLAGNPVMLNFQNLNGYYTKAMTFGANTNNYDFETFGTWGKDYLYNKDYKKLMYKNIANTHTQDNFIPLGTLERNSYYKIKIALYGVHMGGTAEYIIFTEYTPNNDTQIEIKCVSTNYSFYNPLGYTEFWGSDATTGSVDLYIKQLKRCSVNNNCATASPSAGNAQIQIEKMFENSGFHFADLTAPYNTTNGFQIRVSEQLFLNKDRTTTLKTVNLDNTATKLAALSANNTVVYRNAGDNISSVTTSANLVGNGFSTPLDLSNTGVAAGTFPTATFDTKGRATSARGESSRIATTATTTQTIASTQVTATSPILLTFEGTTNVPVWVSSRVAGTSFTVTYQTAPTVGTFLNYVIH